MPRFFAVFFVSFRLPAAAGSIRPFAARPRGRAEGCPHKKKGPQRYTRTVTNLFCFPETNGLFRSRRKGKLRRTKRPSHIYPAEHGSKQASSATHSSYRFLVCESRKRARRHPAADLSPLPNKYSTNVNFIKLFRGRFAKIFSRFFRPRTKKRLTQCKRFCRGAFIRLSLPARRAPPLRSARAEGRGSPRAALPS